MQQLWAPWRCEYLKKVNNPGCFLCQALKEKKDRTNFIITRAKNAFVIMNRYPYNSGHLLIAPNCHKARLEDLTKEEILGLFDLVIKMKRLLERKMKPEGFNIGLNLGRIAGAGLRTHVHFHLVPRWGGDTNFMPILGKTKVISQALHQLYKHLTLPDKPI